MLSGPISRDTAILSLLYPISRYTFQGRLAKMVRTPPPLATISHRRIRAIPHFATYRTIIVRYPIKTSTKEFCDTMATSIARYEKYRCWADAINETLGLSRPTTKHPSLHAHARACVCVCVVCVCVCMYVCVRPSGSTRNALVQNHCTANELLVYDAERGISPCKKYMSAIVL